MASLWSGFEGPMAAVAAAVVVACVSLLAPVRGSSSTYL